MTFEMLLASLINGDSTVQSFGTAQGYKAFDEKSDGKETGFKIVKATGGRIGRKVAETTLLNGLQGLLVRKGFVNFGSEAVTRFAGLFSETETATGNGEETQTTVQLDAQAVSDLQNDLVARSVAPSNVTAIVNRYLKQRDITLLITDAQALEVLGAVCYSERATATAVKTATDEDLQTALATANKFNTATASERGVTVNALTAHKQAVTLTATAKA